MLKTNVVQKKYKVYLRKVMKYSTIEKSIDVEAESEESAKLKAPKGYIVTRIEEIKE